MLYLRRLESAAAVVAALGVSGMAMTAAASPPATQPRSGMVESRPRRSEMGPNRKTESIHGVVEGFNLAPRGAVAGVLVKTDHGLAQLNVPPEIGASLEQSIAAGDTVDAEAVEGRQEGDHAVYDLQSIQGPKGAKVTIPSPADMKLVHVEGTVKQLNYDRQGRVDGVQLDNGDYVHLGPAAEQVKLTQDQKLTVDGYGMPMLGGHEAIEAIQVNGELIRRPPPPEGRGGPGGPRAHGHHGSGGPGGPQGGPGGQNDRGGPDQGEEPPPPPVPQ